MFKINSNNFILVFIFFTSQIALSNFEFPVAYKNVSTKNSSLYNNNLTNENLGLNDKEVILTFDDGPRLSTTPRVLETLNKYNAKAVFFMIGHKIDSSTFSLVQDIAKSGHAVGSHTYGSPSNGHSCIANTWNCKKQNVIDGFSFFPSALSLNKAKREITLGHQMVAAALNGYASPFFRFPFGEHDSDLGNFLTTKNLIAFQWQIDTKDAVNPNQNSETFIQNTLNELDKYKKGIILFHDSIELTASSLESFLIQLYEKGYKPVLPLPYDVDSNQLDTNNPTLVKIK